MIMKYLVTGYKTDWIEVEADSEAEAEKIGSELLGRPDNWDYFEAVEAKDD